MLILLRQRGAYAISSAIEQPPDQPANLRKRLAALSVLTRSGDVTMTTAERLPHVASVALIRRLPFWRRLRFRMPQFRRQSRRNVRVQADFAVETGVQTTPDTERILLSDELHAEQPPTYVQAEREQYIPLYPVLRSSSEHGSSSAAIETTTRRAKHRKSAVVFTVPSKPSSATGSKPSSSRSAAEYHVSLDF